MKQDKRRTAEKKRRERERERGHGGDLARLVLKGISVNSESRRLWHKRSVESIAERNDRN